MRTKEVCDKIFGSPGDDIILPEYCERCSAPNMVRAADGGVHIPVFSLRGRGRGPKPHCTYMVNIIIHHTSLASPSQLPIDVARHLLVELIMRL